MSVDNRERRKFFRINDHAYLAYVETELEEVREVPSETFDELYHSRKKIIASLLKKTRQLTGEYPQLPDLQYKLSSIESSLESLSRSMRGDRPINYPNYNVNLSAGGISFPSASRITPGTKLILVMTLYPGHHDIQVIGQVVHNEERTRSDGASMYRIGIEFVSIREAQLTTLKAHVYEIEQGRASLDWL